jgi:hypothetical protein
MVESLIGRVLIDAALLALVLASIVEVAADVRDGPMPRFLSGTLAGFPTSDPATVLGLFGLGGFMLGILYEFLFHSLPGGRLVVGLVAVTAFLFAGGFIIGGGDRDEGGTRG